MKDPNRRMTARTAQHVASARDIHILADVLRTIVHMGLGVAFSIDDAFAFWADKVLPCVRLARGVRSSRETATAWSERVS